MADSGDARDTASSHATPPSPALPGPPESSLKRKRGRQGCLNCRRKRKKCDEAKPTCSKCLKHQEACQWDTGVIFRHNGLSREHPSMREASLNRQQQQQDFAIIDVTSSVARACREGSSSPDDGAHDDEPRKNIGLGHRGSWSLDKAAEKSSSIRRAASLSSAESARPFGVMPSPHLVRQDTAPYSASNTGSPDVQSQPFKSPGFSDNTSISDGSFAHPRGSVGTLLNAEDGRSDPPKSLLHIEHSSSSNTPGVFVTYQNALPTPASAPPDSRMHMDHDASGLSTGELAALDFLTSQPQMGIIPGLDTVDQPPWMHGDMHGEPSPFSTDNILSPDSLGLYYPSSAYRDLQQNLHTHILETARNTGLTRQGTPDLSLGPGSRRPSLGAEHDPETISSAAARLEFFAQTPHMAKHLTAQREIELWQNYLTEISPWLDKFDNKRHFELTVPQMAKTSDHLRYSILTLSARQQERKDPSRPYTESLGLYQEAIKHLVPELETINSAVIASCVLLCVLEMIIVSPKDWGRHLDGCAIMLQAANINGSVGGVNQALFWCFARMDVWGAYLSDSCTKIPLDRWLSSSLPMAAAVDVFKSTSAHDFDSYANYAVFLCGSVVNVINSRGDAFSVPDTTGTSPTDTRTNARTAFIARWRALFDLVDDWYASRPPAMQPILSYPASATDTARPFPKILYGNPPAANGAQLYHFCAIRLLQERPKEVRLPLPSAAGGSGGGGGGGGGGGPGKSGRSRSLIWHARMICGIAESCTNHGAWINGLQPVWVAGRLMSHPCEHRAILRILERIERESGWATGWRAAELREYWGDVEG